MKLRLQAIAKLAQPDKIFPGRFVFFGNRRDRHQPQDRQSRQREQRFHLRTQFIRLKPKLTPLACHIHFKQDARMRPFFLRDPIYLLRERERIDAVDQFKQWQRVTDFIFLQMSHKMPPQIRRQLRNFYSCLLHPTFAEQSLAGFNRLTNSLGLVRLGNRDKLNIINTARRFDCRLRDPFTNVREIFSDGTHEPRYRPGLRPTVRRSG